MTPALKLSRYGTLNTWDLLKVLGLVLMFADHYGVFFAPGIVEWRIVGRGAAVVFLFLAGMSTPRQFPGYLLLLATALALLDAFISPGWSPLNILFSILFARALIARIESGRLQLHKPLEWMLVLILLIPTIALFQYGSFAFMFALAAYMHRHPERYALRTRQGFLLIAIGFYAAIESAGLQLDAPHIILLLAVLAPLAWLMMNFSVRPVSLPRAIELPAKFLARYSLWVYALHLGALMLLTGQGY